MMASPSIASSYYALRAMSSIARCCFLLLLPWSPSTVMRMACANPKSRPYVAYRTSPFDQVVGDKSPTRIMMDGIEVSGGASVSGVQRAIVKNDVNRLTRARHVGGVEGEPGGVRYIDGGIPVVR